MTKIEITIDDETAATLRATAQEFGVSVAAVASMVVTRYAQRYHEATTGVRLNDGS